MSTFIDAIHSELQPKGSKIRDFGRAILSRFSIPKISIPYADVILVITCLITMLTRPHALYTYCISRLIRVGAIYLVRFPNPHPRANQIRRRCHDLIVSGHASTWTTIFLCNDWKILTGPLAAYHLYHSIVELHHYSVDIYLGIVISVLTYLTSTQTYIPLMKIVS